MSEDRFSVLLYRTSITGILLGVVATVYFLAGLAGQVGNLFLNIFVAASLAASALFFLRMFFDMPQDTNQLGRTIWSSIALVLAVEVLLCLVPPVARDELTHHLAIPRLYVRAGRIIEVPIAPYSYFPMLLEMLYTPWIYWGYDSVPKLIHALFGFLTGLAIFAYLSRRMNAVYGLLGFFFFISVPAVLRLTHEAYVDLGTLFYSTAALFCLLRWREKRDSTRWLVLAALASGFAAATKPNGLLGCFVLFCLFALSVAREPRRGFGKISSEIALFGLLAALPLLPWLVKNWFQTGNPFFPLLGGVFSAHGSGASGGSPGTFVDLGIFTRRVLLYGERWWEIALLPLRVFFAGQDNNPRYFDGVLSPVLILFLPWAFKGKWVDEKKVLFSFALLYFAYAFFLADLRIRYILLIVPPLIGLFAYGVFNIYLRIKQPAYLFAALLLFAGFHISYLWRYVQQVDPLNYLTGRETRSAYLSRMLPEYPVFEHINRQLPATAKIYLLFVGRRAYYCDRDYFHDGGELPGFLLSALKSAQDSAHVEKILKTKNITHLMIQTELLRGYLSNSLSPQQGAIWNEFAARELHLIFQNRGYALYEFHG